MKRIRKKLWKWLIPSVVAAFTLILLKGVFLIGYVPTGSMEPTLKKGSYIVGIRRFQSLEKGDIIIFYHEGKMLVKRIAAVGGEYVEKDGKRLLVPDEYYFVLGDNADDSYDSRYWEEPFVDMEDIAAKLIG